MFALNTIKWQHTSKWVFILFNFLQTKLILTPFLVANYLEMTFTLNLFADFENTRGPLYSFSVSCLLSSQEMIIVWTITQKRLSPHFTYSSPCLLCDLVHPFFCSWNQELVIILLQNCGPREYTEVGREWQWNSRTGLGNVCWFPSELWWTQLHLFTRLITEASGGVV